MDLTARKALTDALSKLSTEIAADMRPQLLGALRAKAEALHKEERVGEGFEVWTDLLARRGAVLWVLKSVYVRVLEDRGLLRPGRILDPESQALFEHLAPNLGPTEYLRWVFRDLGKARGGLPELFAPQAAEIARPSDALSQRLLDFWRRRDTESGSGEVVFRFDAEHFDGRLMGDLYQDLDPVVKKRYALLQTPDFVLDFILDETLTPAIAEWGVEKVRVLDPACGSGHFLLAAFKRLVAGVRDKFPERSVRAVVEDVLARVVGIDLNDYACALARARLVMTALELCGDKEIGPGSTFHPQVFWADALEQVEKDEVGQLGLFAGEGKERPRALLTRPEVRAALRPVLKQGFHVVVGNPPYITEKDATKREYHKEKVGKSRRYVSAAGKYSLGAPFTERMLQLCVDGGFMGEITADSFMKREFGKALIQDVLARRELFKVVSTSGAYVPGHGTPTVLVFARNRKPEGGTVRVVMSKRGEPGRPDDPAKGMVWSSIAEGHREAGYESEFVSVGDILRTTMSQHPWSIGGGGAADLKLALEAKAGRTVGSMLETFGFGSVPGEDELYELAAPERFGMADGAAAPLVLGDGVRNWATRHDAWILFPYLQDGIRDASQFGNYATVVWRFRAQLWIRRGKGFATIAERGGVYYEYCMFYPERYYSERLITVGEVATHNHFALGGGGRVFGRTAPILKLALSDEAQHLVLLAQLNSAVACFWLKQVCQSKGIRGEGGGFTPDEWEHFYQFGGTKIADFPLIATDHPQLESFARHLDALARARVDDSPRAAIDATASSGTAALRAALLTRRARDLTRLYRMVGLQEELDWLCYKLYGLDPDADIRDPADVPPLTPGYRPFEITLAQEDAERRAALARGEEPDEQPTAWFDRHGWTPYSSPGICASSSTARESSPGAENISPTARDRSPAARDRSPAVWENSPAILEPSAATPEGFGIAAERSPTARERSPGAENIFPAARDRSPAIPERAPAAGELPGLGAGQHNFALDPLTLARLERTAASRDLSLVEQPTYKRRWYRPDHDKEEREALDLWLADRLEAWARDRKEPFTVRQAASALQADPAVLAVAELLAARADFDLDALVAERLRLDSVPGNKHHVFKPEGLLKRRAWEKTWELQHLEDAGKLPLAEDGKPVPIPVPDKYERTDYQKPETWSLRGKLDVPKERYLAFTEAPPEAAEEPLFGWAGWTPRQRARALLALDEKAEGAGVKVQERYGLLYGVWFLLPYVAWESVQAAADFRADVKSLVGEQGVTEEMLEEWAKAWAERRQAAGKKGKAAPKRAARKAKE